MDPVVAELIAQLVRKGTLDREDVLQISGALTRLGHDDLAHDVNVSFIEAHTASLAEQVEARRATFKVVAQREDDT